MRRVPSFESRETTKRSLRATNSRPKCACKRETYRPRDARLSSDSRSSSRLIPTSSESCTQNYFRDQRERRSLSRSEKKRKKENGKLISRARALHRSPINRKLLFCPVEERGAQTSRVSQRSYHCRAIAAGQLRPRGSREAHSRDRKRVSPENRAKSAADSTTCNFHVSRRVRTKLLIAHRSARFARRAVARARARARAVNSSNLGSSP